MTLDETGRVVKCCEMCGKRMDISDWFAALATKYCRDCAATQTRLNKAAYMRDARQRAREKRRLEQERTRITAQENDLLREALRLQEARIQALERMLEVYGEEED